MNSEGFLESAELLAYLGGLQPGQLFDLPLVLISVVKLIQRQEGFTRHSLQLEAQRLVPPQETSDHKGKKNGKKH